MTSIPSVETISHLSDAKELIDYLVEVKAQHTEAVFRGQALASWGLLPSAWRSPTLDETRRLLNDHRPDWLHVLPDSYGKTAEQVASRYFQPANAERIVRLRELVNWLAAEHWVVSQFCIACDRVALPVPGLTSPEWIDTLIDERIIDPSGSEKGLLLPVPVMSLNERHAFVQHMELPTRLLDFSDSPLKAAFFAAENAMKAASPKEHHFAIWIAIPPVDDGETAYSEFVRGSDARQFRVLRSGNANLHAQDGLFISCNASSNRYFLNHGVWPTFETIMHEWEFKKVTFDAFGAHSLLERLKHFGIEGTMLRPSYASIAGGVRARWCTPVKSILSVS
jgi:hypothetical protein